MVFILNETQLQQRYREEQRRPPQQQDRQPGRQSDMTGQVLHPNGGMIVGG